MPSSRSSSVQPDESHRKTLVPIEGVSWGQIIERRRTVKRRRFSEEQIIGILRGHKGWQPDSRRVPEAWVSSATFYIYGLLPRGKKV
jgi:hypothetical protein